MGRLEGKTAIVTGGASGVGLAITTSFFEEGANVIIADLQPPKEDSDFRDSGKVKYLKTDVTEEKQIEAAVAFAVETFGRLDM